VSDVDAELLARLAALAPAEVLRERERRRALERGNFLERAGRWLSGRGGRVRLPEDRAAIIALGVPCADCLELVTEDGAGGHLVELRCSGGERFGASIAARCGRRLGLPVVVAGR
jgi:hypothetical protein